MLVSACALPHPPVLIPQVVGHSPDWLVALREICLDATTRVVSADPDVVVVVGTAAESARWSSAAGGSMAAYGVEVGAGSSERCLPLSLTIGAWLLDRVGWTGLREYVAVDPSVEPREAALQGRGLVADRRTAMLVMGDGTAKRTKQAPGYLDDRAATFDARVVKALSSLDADAIRQLEAALADELWVAGLPAWRLFAGAAEQVSAALVRYDEAPTGVGYFVIDFVSG